MTGKDKYSISARVVRSEKDQSVTLTLPFFPTNPVEAGGQIDNMVLVWSTALDLYTLDNMMESVMYGTKSGISEYSGLGVPGVFSIFPVPVVNENGTVGFKITGVLAKRLAKFKNILSPHYSIPYCISSDCSF